MVARVVLDTSLDRVFDYAVPAELDARAVPGARVSVPFGPRTAIGYILERAADSPHSPLRPIASVLGEGAFLLPGVLALARWIGDYYLAPVESCVRAALPAPVRSTERAGGRERPFVSLPPQKPGGPLPDGGGDDGLTPRQRELLGHIRRVGGGWMQALCREFGCSADTIRRLAAAGCLVLENRAPRRDPLANRRVLPSSPLPLMPEQAAALEQIEAACEAPSPRPLLLLGVTGSGKTEVYLQAIARVLDRGRGAIVLVPEIALTPQTVQRFAARFGSAVAVLHSALTAGERRDEWHRIRSGAARVVVGPRSAVFAPVSPLGLIVVDEEHEPSYKQEESPRYHARDAAVMRGHLERCPVVLGSATPSLESWHNAERGKYSLARLPRRADDRSMPAVRLVDMRLETARKGRVQVLSEALLEALRERLRRGEQSMLFLNRRGFATALLCPRCGFVASCPSCSVSFTYHQADRCLRCHACGGWQEAPAACPGCRDPSIRYSGIGTQRVEAIVRACFPEARIARLDTDITARRSSHDEVLGTFRSGRTDILVGTQMIAKGLHFPNVTLVGVVLADSSLSLPDFRASERTFQLLAQVSGRAGRGEVPGEVIVQTYAPHHPAVAAAQEADFETFVRGEMRLRRELGYPPFVHLACLGLRGVSEERTGFCAATLARALQAGAAGTARVSDACTAPLARAQDRYRFQILVRSASSRALHALLRRVLPANKLPEDVALAVDVDAVSML